MAENISGSCRDQQAFMAMAQAVKRDGDKMFSIIADERLEPMSFALSDGLLRLGTEAFAMFAAMAIDQGHKAHKVPLTNPAVELN